MATLKKNEVSVILDDVLTGDNEELLNRLEVII